MMNPMTINKLEPTLLGFRNAPNLPNHGHSNPKDSGYMQIPSALKHEYDDEENFTGDDSTTNEEWEPGSKMLCMPDASDYKVTSPCYSSTDSNGPLPPKSGSKISNRPTGPRKPRKDVQLTPEDEEKRRLRRERNKQAAAKCRQKRVDLTNQLQAETESLESEQLRLQEEIKVFQREKEELELILNTHRFHCGADTVGSLNSSPLFSSVAVSGGSSHAAPVVLVRPAAPVSSAPVSSAVTGSSVSSLVSSAQTSEAVSGMPSQNAHTPLAVVVAPVANGNSVSRPTSFPTSSLRTMAMVATSTGPNVLTFGLESMLDGHTGLTPITGMPSCAIAIVGQQMQPMTPNDNVNNAAEATTAGLTAL